MINEKIVNGNKLISEFDGFPKSDYDLMIYSAISFKMNEGYNEDYAKTDYDLYHNCWKFLMPICQKIKNVCIEENWNSDIEEVGNVQESILNLDISDIHQACVSFIVYYNNKKAENTTSAFFQ
jgi:hypothetical protein